MNFHGDLDLSFQKFHRGGQDHLKISWGRGFIVPDFPWGGLKKREVPRQGGFG